MEPGRPVEEGGEREVGVVLRLRMEAHLRPHLVPDLLHFHHFDRGQNPRAGRSRGEEGKQRRERSRGEGGSREEQSRSPEAAVVGGSARFVPSRGPYLRRQNVRVDPTKAPLPRFSKPKLDAKKIVFATR